MVKTRTSGFQSFSQSQTNLLGTNPKFTDQFASKMSSPSDSSGSIQITVSPQPVTKKRKTKQNEKSPTISPKSKSSPKQPKHKPTDLPPGLLFASSKKKSTTNNARALGILKVKLGSLSKELFTNVKLQLPSQPDTYPKAPATITVRYTGKAHTFEVYGLSNLQEIEAFQFTNSKLIKPKISGDLSKHYAKPDKALSTWMKHLLIVVNSEDEKTNAFRVFFSLQFYTWHPVIVPSNFYKYISKSKSISDVSLNQYSFFPLFKTFKRTCLDLLQTRASQCMPFYKANIAFGNCMKMYLKSNFAPSSELVKLKQTFKTRLQTIVDVDGFNLGDMVACYNSHKDNPNYVIAHALRNTFWPAPTSGKNIQFFPFDKQPFIPTTTNAPTEDIVSGNESSS